MLIRLIFILFAGLIFESSQRLFYVACHEEIDIMLVVVTIDWDANILASFLILVKVVIFF